MGKRENINNYYKRKSAINHCIKSRGNRAREAYQNCFGRASNFQGTFEEFRQHIEKRFETLAGEQVFSDVLGDGL